MGRSGGRGRGRGRGASPGGRGRGGRGGGASRRGYHSDGGDTPDFISLFVQPPGSRRQREKGALRALRRAADDDDWQSDDSAGDGTGVASAGISIGARRSTRAHAAARVCA